MDSRLNKVLRDFDDRPANRKNKKPSNKYNNDDDDDDEDDLCQLMDKYA
jgi:hypothetical protein